MVSAAAFFSTWIVGSAVLWRWQGVTLTPSALYVHSLRPRVIGWPDIASLGTDRLLGGTFVIVWETSGRSTLPVGSDPPSCRTRIERPGSSSTNSPPPSWVASATARR